MGCPVAVFSRHRFTCAQVNLASGHLFHGDAALNGADIDAQIARHAFIVFDAKHTVLGHFNRLVAGVFAGRITASAFDAIILIDHRFSDEIQV